MSNQDSPAYPFKVLVGNIGDDTSTSFQFTGLTKLELVSAMCLQGILAGNDPDIQKMKMEVQVQVAVNYGKELLKQLEKPQP